MSAGLIQKYKMKRKENWKTGYIADPYRKKQLFDNRSCRENMNSISFIGKDKEQKKKENNRQTVKTIFKSQF